MGSTVCKNLFHMKITHLLLNWKACLYTWVALFITWVTLISIGLKNLASPIGYLFLLAIIWVIFQIIFQLTQKRWKEAFISFVVPLLSFIIGIPVAIIFSISMENDKHKLNWEFPENIPYLEPIPINVEDEFLDRSTQFHELLDSLKQDFRNSDLPFDLKVISTQKQGCYRYLFFSKDPNLKAGHLQLKGFEYSSEEKVFNGDNFVKISPYSKKNGEVDCSLSRRFWIHQSNQNRPFLVRTELWFSTNTGQPDRHILLRNNYKMKGWFRDYH